MKKDLFRKLVGVQPGKSMTNKNLHIVPDSSVSSKATTPEATTRDDCLESLLDLIDNYEEQGRYFMIF